MRAVALVLALTFASSVSASSSGAQVFACDNAEVRVSVVARNSSHPEERAEAVVTVALRGIETVLRYRGVDYVGGQCLNETGVRPLVVFQAHCGGSTCQDLANWGVIDARTLRVLAVPTDTNRLDVQNIIGNSTLPTLKKMSVTDEARKQGVQVY